MPLIVPKKLRALVESYIMAKGRDKEKGGYLMGREKVHSLIETLSDEIDKLKSHRHDASKQYTGRPET